jgi:hypothetical protein
MREKSCRTYVRRFRVSTESATMSRTARCEPRRQRFPIVFSAFIAAIYHQALVSLSELGHSMSGTFCVNF